jgi:hypothetical protein
MKKIVLLVSIVFLFNSCSSDDSNVRVHYAMLPVISTVVPDSFTYGETYEIKMTYYAPTTCHSFDGVYYDKVLNTRTFAIQSRVYELDNCTTNPVGNLSEATFNLKIDSYDMYYLKFWRGNGVNGEGLFLEYEIPVN